MPTFTYKVLGQAAPSGTTNVDLYTVGTGKSAIVSSIVVCNVTGTAAKYRIFQRIAGATAGISNAVAYDATVAANSTTSVEIKMTLAASDVLTVQSDTASALTFTANGSEIA
jgi:hypothetical protein